MSVASKNPFALLDDADNSRPASPAPAAKAPAPAAQAPAAPKATQQKSRGPASRGGKYYPRGGKPSAAREPSGADEPADEAKKVDGGRGARAAGRGRGRGGNAGGRGRPFDKHSQTGKTDSQKKVHQGWGGDEGKTELKTEEQGAADAAAEPAVDAPEGETAAAEGDAKPEGRPRREREVEEEDNTLTLEQYLAQQKEKDTVIPKLEGVRQANDGAGEDLWKDAVALTKPEEESYFVGKQKSAGKPKAKKDEKVFLEIDARFERPDRGGPRGRGGRGGDRGGDRRGRGAARGARPARQTGGATPNVDDQKAFPTLS